MTAGTATETWTPATAVSVRAGDTVRYRGICGWREVTVREVDHAWPAAPVVITSATGAVLHIRATAAVEIRGDSEGHYNR